MPSHSLLGVIINSIRQVRNYVRAQQYLRAVQEGAEKRLAQIQEEGREVWNGLGEKYDLPLETVSYALSSDSKKLVATMVKAGV